MRSLGLFSAAGFAALLSISAAAQTVTPLGQVALFPIDIQFQKGWNITASGGGAFNYTIAGAASAANSAAYTSIRPTGSSSANPSASLYDSVIDNAINFTGSQEFSGRRTDYSCCSNGANGAKSALTGQMNVGTTFATANPQALVGVTGRGIATVNLGGISGTEVGNLFGLYGIARCTVGCTYWQGVFNELDAAVENVGSPPATFAALLLSDTDGHVTHGSLTDSELILTKHASGAGFINGITIGGGGLANHFPFSATGSVLWVNSPGTVNYGIDFWNGTSNLTCTFFCFRSNGFSVDGSGNTILANLTLTGSVLSDLTVNGHIIGGGTAWSCSDITFNAGAGTGPSCTVVTGSDGGFHVQFTSGTTPSASAGIFQFTFKSAYTSGRAPLCQFSPESTAAAVKSTAVYESVGNTTYTLAANTTALAASTNYAWAISCKGY